MTSSENTLKILVSGDVDGKFNQLFSRVSSVNKKNGPFEMLICVGNFFGENNDEWNLYVKGINEVPITTYVMGPCKLEHEQFYSDINGCELAHNITYLGRKGILSCSSGLKVAYLSGVEMLNDKCEKYQFNATLIKDLMLNFTEGLHTKGVDILLTSQWPKYIEKYGRAVKNMDSEKCGSDLIAKLAYVSKPRYHFAGFEGIYYERLPYRNHQVLAEAARHVTRFIALNKVGNVAKEKWLYAFSIIPQSKMDRTDLVRQPLDVTECPYKFSENDINCTFKKEVPQQFFYNLDTEDEDMSKNRKRKGESYSKDQKKNKLHAPCWFCLASPEVEKHLVVSIGDHNYLALAKGCLTPDHILILPIAHHQSIVELPSEALDEIKKYKGALKRFFHSQNKTVVFFERNYKTSHLQIQVVPLPRHMINRLKDAFDLHAEQLNISLGEIPANAELQQVMKPGNPYFYVELESGEKLLHRIQGKFPLQFGREVLASEELLDKEERSDWKACKYSKDEEVKMAEDFKKAFEAYDFTLE